ncbi:MAG TPA: TraR/DksA C4-type zinc finger protein [Blastocatellia bacterium]|nr:TraR/DksA C4-type zinc finger protein [Blastocatellia bacterium]
MDVKGRVLDAAPGFEVSRSICREAEEALRAERSRLLDVLIAGSRPGVDVPGDWQESDSAAINEIRDLEFCHRQALHDRLRDLDAALERIRYGSYGECTICGEPIGKRRIENDPAVSLCLACQCAIEGDSCIPTL